MELVIDHRKSGKVTGTCLQVGEGMAGQLIRDGRPYMIVDDYSNWAGHAEIYRNPCPFGAVVAVPLRWHDQVTGVLYIDDDVGRRFTDENARLLGLFAQTAASALANQRLMVGSEEKLLRLELLSRYITTMMDNLETMTLSERLSLIARQATEIFNAECCSVFQVKRPGYLSLVAGHGHRPGSFTEGREFSIRSGKGTGLSGHIAYEGELFNAYGEELTNHFAVVNPFSNHTPSGVCHSLLAIPIKKKERNAERLIGLLSIDNKRDKGGRARSTLSFDQEDEWIIRIFAEAVAISIDTAEWTDRLNLYNKQADQILNGLPMAAISADLEGNIIQFNTPAERVLGFKAIEVIGTKVQPLYFDPQEARRIGKLLYQAPQGRISNHKTYLRNKSGRAIPIRLTATWLYDERGERMGSAGYFEDLRLTERFELIHHAGKVVIEAENLSEGLQGMSEMLTELFPECFCRILLLSEESESLRVEAASLGSALSVKWNSGIGANIPLSEYPGLKRLLEKAEPELIAHSDPRMQEGLDKLRAYLELDQTIQQLLVLPLVIDKQPIGLIDLGELIGQEQSQFIPENVRLATTIATQSLVLIDKMRLLSDTLRRELLLQALLAASERMLAPKGLPYLLPEIVRLAAQLLGFEYGGLCFNRDHLAQLQVQAVFGLPETLIGQWLQHGDGLLGITARIGHIRVQHDYSSWPEQEALLKPFDLQTMVSIPLKRPSGQVEAVLFVATQSPRAVTEDDQEILGRFAAQAFLALQISRSSTREHRTHEQLNTLHQISNYTLAIDDQEKLLHAVLTGITARYGMRFNRAVLMLKDETGKALRGISAIGQLTTAEAEKAWEEDEKQGLADFASYCEQVNREGITWTNLAEKILEFSLPITPEAPDCFNKAIRQQHHLRVERNEIERLPAAFRQMIEPETDVIIVPLNVKGQVIGLIAVDNKFTRSPITDEDLDLLIAFANTAAVALDHNRLLYQTRAVNTQLLSLYSLSQELFVEQNPQRLPELIVQKLQRAAGAQSASLLLIDSETGRVENPFIVPPHTPKFLAEWVRPNGLSMQVLLTGEAIALPDIKAEIERVNPHILGTDVQAALCLPLSLSGRQRGVIWLHYDCVHDFNPLEISALKLYVDHAAIAYENAERLERIERLSEATSALACITDSDSIEKEIARQARRVFRADAVILWLYDKERDDFISPRSVADGISDEKMKEYRLVRPHHQGTAWQIMSEGAIQVSDATDLFQTLRLGPLTRQIVHDQNARGFCGLALNVGGEKLGVLYVLYQYPLRLDLEEQKMALTFANHAALALRNARQLERLQHIRQAAKKVAAATLSDDRESTLRSIVIWIKEVTDCDAVSLFEHNPKTGHLLHSPTLAGVRDEAAAKSGAEKKDHHLVYRMLNEHKPYIVKSVAADPTFRGNRFARDENVHSLVVFPLKAEEQRVGVLFVNYRRAHQFTDEEVQTLQLFADQAAMALYKQQLYEDHARDLKMKQALGKLSEELLGVASLDEVLERAISNAAEMFDTRYCHIVLRGDDGKLYLRKAIGWCEDKVGKLCLPPGRGSLTGYTIEQERPIIVNDILQEQEFEVLSFVNSSSMRSVVSVPMWRDRQVVGAMLIHSLEPYHFGKSEADLLQLVANQTAIAIRSAERFDILEIRRRHMAAVNEAARAITASFGLDRKPVLDQIVKQAVEGVTGMTGVVKHKATIATLFRYDEGRDELTLESIWPLEREAQLLAKMGGSMHPKQTLEAGKRIGIIGRCCITGAPQLVPDVHKNPDYLAFNPNSRSELAVPLIEGDRVIGVLNVESQAVGGFHPEDEEAMQALAKHAVIILGNARQHQQLKEMKVVAEARVTLALLGISSSTWGHNASGKAITIFERVNLLRDDLHQGKPLQEVEEHLSMIQHLATELGENVPQFPLDSEAVTRSEPIYSVTCERLKKIWELKKYAEQGFRYEILPPEDVGVRVKGYSLLITRVLDILISNAIRAMASSEKRYITIGFRTRNNRVEVAVRDTGCGISPELLGRLFREPIYKAPREEGSGYGLLIAINIVRAFGGELLCLKPGPGDTTMVFTWPLDESDPTGENILESKNSTDNGRARERLD